MTQPCGGMDVPRQNGVTGRTARPQEERSRKNSATARRAQPQEQRSRKNSAAARTAARRPAARGVTAENRKLGGAAAERPESARAQPARVLTASDRFTVASAQPSAQQSVQSFGMRPARRQSRSIAQRDHVLAVHVRLEAR